MNGDDGRWSINPTAGQLSAGSALLPLAIATDYVPHEGCSNPDCFERLGSRRLDHGDVLPGASRGPCDLDESCAGVVLHQDHLFPFFQPADNTCLRADRPRLLTERPPPAG